MTTEANQPATTKKKRQVVDLDDTRRELRHNFQMWGIDPSEYEILWESELSANAGRLAPGVQVRYMRRGKWQSISSFQFRTRPENLRKVFALIQRLRIAEQDGVQYEGLTFTTALATQKSSPADVAKETLSIYYDFLGVEPADKDETITRVYRAKSTSYHPDAGGDPEKFKRLNHAYEEIKKARGMK